MAWRESRIGVGLPDVTWTADCQGSYSYISPHVEKVLGYSNHEIYAAAPGFLHSRIHPEDKERVQSAYAALFCEKKIFDEEYRIAAKNGAWIWIHDRAVSTHCSLMMRSLVSCLRWGSLSTLHPAENPAYFFRRHRQARGHA